MINLLFLKNNSNKNKLFKKNKLINKKNKLILNQNLNKDYKKSKNNNLK